MTNQSVNRLLCAKEVGRLLGISERTAARLMREGKLPAFKLGGWRTTRLAVEAFIAESLVGSGARLMH